MQVIAEKMTDIEARYCKSKEEYECFAENIDQGQLLPPYPVNDLHFFLKTVYIFFTFIFFPIQKPEPIELPRPKINGEKLKETAIKTAGNQPVNNRSK